MISLSLLVLNFTQSYSFKVRSIKGSSEFKEECNVEGMGGGYCKPCLQPISCFTVHCRYFFTSPMYCRKSWLDYGIILLLYH